jgi:superfamily II DNA or RNA helicase
MKLRENQKTAVQGVCKAARAGERRIVVCQPVGSGKTEIIAELCRLAKRPLVITPLLDLMRQARDRLEMRLGERCDIEQGAMVAESMEGLRRRVIVGSRDSLLSRGRYKAKAYQDVSLVCVDECHVGITPRLEQMLEWFQGRGATIVGFSATPYKGKGRPLRWWPRPQVVYSLREGIDDGYLVSPKCYLSQSTALDMSVVDEVAGDWDKKQLAAVLTAEHFVQEVSSLVLQTHAGQPSVVYAACVRQAELLMEVFSRYGAPAAVVHSRQNPLVRKENMDAFVSGQAKIIVNVGILGYGWDHPELRNIYMATPTRSLSRYEQRLGRGTRALPGVIQPEMTKEERLQAIRASDKPHFNVWDITDSSRTHQLLSALDVLDAKILENKRRRQLSKEMAADGDGIALEDAVRTLDEIEAEEREQERAALREKRKGLIVGVTFEHDTRDLFDAPVEQKKKRGWRMLWNGKYRGELIENIPSGYLRFVMKSAKKKDAFTNAVSRELARRDAGGSVGEGSDGTTPPVATHDERRSA